MEKNDLLDKERKTLRTLEKQLKIRFKDNHLLIQAFTHASFLNEHPDFHLENNERLEFLGDAVLELIVSQYLYQHYSQREGYLTKWRAALVNTHSLAKVGESLGFDRYLLISEGEKKNNDRAKERHLEDGVEAFIGALYLDRGLKLAKKFIGDYLLGNLPEIISSGTFQDSKTLFQEKMQGENGLTPRYKVLSESGPDHRKKFKVGVFLEDRFIAQGRGPSKQRAEEEAAQQALKINYHVKN